MPAFVEAPTATKWFETLRFSVAWKSERRWMYDREVEVPRLVASYRLSDTALPEVLEQAARRATDFTGEPFNSVGLNLYRDGHDSVAPHNDHLYEIVRGHSIALLSLGGARRMTIRSKNKPRRAFDLDLENGSLLLMSYETQVNYDHGVPKSKAPVQARISVALRVRPSTPVRVTRR